MTLEPTVPDLVVDGAGGLPLSRGTESSAQRNVTGLGIPSPSPPVSSFEIRGSRHCRHTGSSGMYIRSCRASLAYVGLQPSSLSSDSGRAVWEEWVSVPPAGQG